EAPTARRALYAGAPPASREITGPDGELPPAFQVAVARAWLVAPALTFFRNRCEPVLPSRRSPAMLSAAVQPERCGGDRVAANVRAGHGGVTCVGSRSDVDTRRGALESTARGAVVDQRNAVAHDRYVELR